MRRHILRFFLLLSVVCVTVSCAGPSWAADAGNRYIKVVGVEDRVLTLDVDGKPVRIPLPEGYEVMREEEFAETYKYIVEREARTGDILLCILVDSRDVLKRRSGIIKNEYKVITFSVIDVHIKRRYSQYDFVEERTEIEKLQNTGRKWANSELQKKGQSPFSIKKIYEGSKAISFIETEDYASQGDYQFGLTISYILFDNVVITSLLQKNMKDSRDRDVLTQDTLNYINLVGRQM